MDNYGGQRHYYDSGDVEIPYWRWKADVRDADGLAPIHIATWEGNLERVKYLVSRRYNPHVGDNDGETALHRACWKGYLDIVRYLVGEAHCDANTRDNDGWTPLHIACSENDVDAVEYLLVHGRANPNCTTKDGRTPLSLTIKTDVIKLLLQHGALVTNISKFSMFLPNKSPRKAAEATIPVFMVGDKGAGKTTLTKALTTEKASIVRWTGRVSRVSGVKEKTAGIECHTIHSSRIGNLSIYDLAGHREFHNAHDTIIRSSISSLSSAIFLLVINLGMLVEDLKRTISYWMFFVESQITLESSSKPYLLAVGSHYDLVKSKTELEEKESILRRSCESAENVDFVDYVRVDCRYSESPSLTHLRVHILATHDKLQHKVPQINLQTHSFHIYLVSEFGSKPGMKLSNLMKRIQSNLISSKEMFLPLTMNSLHEACRNLNKRGVMLFIQTQSIENSWIIIDKDMLLREVNGSVFAPTDFDEHKSLTKTGVVPFSKIESSFSGFDPQLIADFLVHMEFCRQMTAEDGLKLVIQTHPEYSRESHFLFPGLTPLDPPPYIWEPNPLISYSEYSSCWILQCQEHHHYLSPRFQQVLLLRLAFTHAFPVESGDVDTASPALQQACTIWRSGIKWTTRSSVDALVEISDKNIVLLLRCGQGKEMQLVKLRAQVMVEIQSVKRELCSNAVTYEKFIPTATYPVHTRMSVSVYEVAHAIFSQEDSVKLTLHTTFPLMRLFHFEPYSFCNVQFLVDLYCKELQCCKITPSSFESLSLTITSFNINNFCTLLTVPLHKIAVDKNGSDYYKALRMFKVWQTQSDGTYQCLRQQMDKYSIFSGRNVLEVAKIPEDSCPPPSAAHSSSSEVQDSFSISPLIGHPSHQDWVEVLDYQITALADTVRGDLTYFSNKFIECGFITQTAANDILSKLGVSNGDKARELLHLVRQNYNISLKKQLWSEKFISIFSSQAAYHDLAMLLKGTSISEGQDST